MIGNDVVDLRDADVAPRARHPRFDARVFAPPEARALESSPTPDRLRWALWAAKEAAFKAARKRDSGLRFSPVRFVAELEGPRGRVRHGDLEFHVQLDVSEERVHALAAHVGDPRAVFRVAESEGDPSREVRDLALRMLARVLGVPRRDLSIVKRSGAPCLLRAGEPAAADVSFSHHGRFVAVAYSLGTAS